MNNNEHKPWNVNKRPGIVEKNAKLDLLHD
jgi:hypothetical protein